MFQFLFMVWALILLHFVIAFVFITMFVNKLNKIIVKFSLV